jgi:CheY-like chemotaxis protein
MHVGTATLAKMAALVTMRVLFVDDEALIVLLATSWLEDMGCEVETAFNGSEALAKLGSDPYVEVLVTDVNMPGLGISAR